MLRRNYSIINRAIKLYESNGFDTLSSPLGTTGHNNCKIWMIKDLNEIKILGIIFQPAK